MGLELEKPAVGCCGHAGSFGYEVQHHPLSLEIAELVLFPVVRKAAPDRFIIADGFSCRQQIQHGTGRWAMHPAEVIALALESRGAVPQTVPERRYLEPAAVIGGNTVAAAAAIGLGISVALILGWRNRAATPRTRAAIR